MRNYTRLLLTAAGLVILFLGADILPVRSAGAAPATPTQDVQIVSPLTANGSVPVEATIKGVVRTRANQALTHVGALASDVVTLSVDYNGARTEVRSDGSASTFVTVPAGKALVITDIEWVGPPTTGSYGQFTLTNSGATVFERIGGLDERSLYSGRQSWTTGITFGPGTTPGFSSGNVNVTPFVLAHGYYVDAP